MKKDINSAPESDNPLIEGFKELLCDLEGKAKEHEKLRESDEYKAELLFLRNTVRDLIHSLRISELAASRWQNFTNNFLLPRHFDDIVEAALIAQLAIENGALNPARRELRYILEVVVNISYVDETKAKDSFEDRVSYYRSKSVNKTNVDHIFQLPLRLLGSHKEFFAKNVQHAWVRASNYVHLTKRRMDEKLQLREQGVTLGFENIEVLKNTVAEVHEVCTIALILVFETIGPDFTGDLLVDCLDEQEEWAFHASEYMAIIDSYFDYKHERKDKICQILQRRNRRIKYHTRAKSPP